MARACTFNPQGRVWGRSSTSLTISSLLGPERKRYTGSSLRRDQSLAYSSQSWVPWDCPDHGHFSAELGPEKHQIQSSGLLRSQIQEDQSSGPSFAMIVIIKTVSQELGPERLSKYRLWPNKRLEPPLQSLLPSLRRSSKFETRFPETRLP